jgi:hypothetical protein
LIGREPECAAIDRMLADVNAGDSSSLVIRGEPGIGRSTLLGHAEHAAADSIVLRTAGQEAESDLAFAGLYGLLRPVADRLSDLPDPQAAALGGALGLVKAQAERDRFLVAAATLTVLAAAAEDQPLLCLIDDAQWLDSASSDALLFAAGGCGPSRSRCCSRSETRAAPRRFSRRVFRKWWSMDYNRLPPRSYSPSPLPRPLRWPSHRVLRRGGRLALLEVIGDGEELT